MAGFFSRNDGYVFEGSLPYAVAKVVGLKNGMFVEYSSGNGGGMILPTEQVGYGFRVVEKTTLNGAAAVRVNVDHVGTKPIYMIEQVAVSSDDLTADGEVVINIGDYLRMRRPMKNDQMVINYAGNPSLEDMLAPHTDGGLTAYSYSAPAGDGNGAPLTLSDLDDVTLDNPENGQVLVYGDGVWANEDPASELDGIVGTQGQVMTMGDDGWEASTLGLDDLDDVDLTVPAVDGEVLKYSESDSAWVAGADETST